MNRMFITNDNIDEICRMAEKLPEGHECRKMAEAFRRRVNIKTSEPEFVKEAGFVIPVPYDLPKEAAEYILSNESIFKDMPDYAYEELCSFAERAIS